MQIQTVCVCGAGTMGSGIAQITAAADRHTVLYEVQEAVLQKAKTTIENNLDVLVQKGKMTHEKRKALLQHIHFTHNIEHCKSDLIIEAIVEKMEAKTALFHQLAEINSSESIFASNTSSLSITALAQQIKNPQRVAGLHFFNPAPLMKLVEVVRGKETGEAVIQTIMAFVQQMNKIPVVCKDAPGFIVNRVARPFYIEALRLAEAGITGLETIDHLLESKGFKLGPFRLMDLIGNDVNYAVSCSVYEQLGQPERLKPSFIQKEKVELGELGRKAGKGYYLYS
ncbi:MAG: 3-hydroxybutyryl-CoA dehydrogenase [Flavisolibacter sp.]|nr:3-hydroxybutyryl-CoA dehydrogenase [Flavisolibacter sp.]